MKYIIERILVYTLYILALATSIVGAMSILKYHMIYSMGTSLLLICTCIFMVTFTVIYCLYSYKIRKAAEVFKKPVICHGKRNINSLDGLNSSYLNLTEEENLTLKQDIKKQYELMGHHNK